MTLAQENVTTGAGFPTTSWSTNTLQVTQSGLYAVTIAITCNNPTGTPTFASGQIWLVQNPSGFPPTGTIQTYIVNLAPSGTGGAVQTVEGPVRPVRQR